MFCSLCRKMGYPTGAKLFLILQEGMLSPLFTYNVWVVSEIFIPSNFLIVRCKMLPFESSYLSCKCCSLRFLITLQEFVDVKDMTSRTTLQGHPYHKINCVSIAS